MSTKQPKWRFLANLGDVDPFISAALVFLDMTGVHEPEMVWFDEDNTREGKYVVRRVVLARCSMLGNKPNTISDNRFHVDKPAWFAQDLPHSAAVSGMDGNLAANLLVSDDPLRRAEAYRALIAYHGPDNFDSYPRLMTRSEIRRHYRAAFPRRKSKGINAHDPKRLVLDAGI